MNILKLKYKMHRMVNIVFYLVIFTFGFLLGFGIDKLNFNNLISKVFMLDNVYALKDSLICSSNNNLFDVNEVFANESNSSLIINDDNSFTIGGSNSWLSAEYEFELQPGIYKISATITGAYDAVELWEIVNNNGDVVKEWVSSITKTKPNYYLIVKEPTEYALRFYNYISSSNVNYTTYSIDIFKTNCSYDQSTLIWDSISESSDGKNIIYTKDNLYDVINIKPNSSTYYNEEYIHSLFNELFGNLSLDISFSDYSNVYSYFYNQGVWDDYYFYFSPSDYTGSYSLLYSSGPGVFRFNIRKNKSSATLTYYSCDDGAESCSILLQSGSFYDFPSKAASSSTNITGLGHYMDFSEYLPKAPDLVYDENLFKNDENFKEVCVKSNSSFSITKNHSDGVLSASDYDFIWFPYGIRGIKQFNYSTVASDGHYEFENPYENFYFSSYEDIDRIWNMEYMADNFEYKGYIDKYKYYGYTAYLFNHWYNFEDASTFNFFPIFTLENPVITHISSSNNIHGGGGLRLDGDEDIILNNEYCFYIKKEYEVNEVLIDEWGDYDININTPVGNNNYSTSVNKNKNDSGGLLVQPLAFINQMSSTLLFINTQIYNLYISMPLIFRSFLITVLIIAIIIMIMKLGGYK